MSRIIATSRLQSSSWRSPSRYAASVRARLHSKATLTQRCGDTDSSVEFVQKRTHDRLRSLLRDELAPDELARLTAEGATLTPEAAITLALEEP